MSEKYFGIKALIKVQQWAWYVVSIYFALVTALYIAEFTKVAPFAKVGVVFILVITGVKLVVMAEQFRLARLYRFWLLSYTLMLILLSTILHRYLL